MSTGRNIRLDESGRDGSANKKKRERERERERERVDLTIDREPVLDLRAWRNSNLDRRVNQKGPAGSVSDGWRRRYDVMR